MASHGRKRHLKRLAKPAIIPISNKGTRYLKKHSPGAHKQLESETALMLLRDILKTVESTKEAKQLLKENQVLVDGKPAKDLAIPIGLMDIVSIPKLSQNFRIINAKGKLFAQSISADEAKVKLCKVANKTIISKGKVQLNLHDGRNCLIEKEEDRFKAGDTVKISIPSQKLSGFSKLEKGAHCYVYRGKHAGAIATLVELKERAGSRPTEAVLSKGGEEFITLKDYLFVVDKDFKTQ